ncbi:MAG: hypothetical protein JWO38_6732 [Gemmataceae bacterium]|nr:hypothetical protein [Gemmataceae bacterium]
MPHALPRPIVRPQLRSWWKVIDWRLVAAVGFPLWAFVFGLMVPRKPATVVAQGPPPVELTQLVPPPPPPDNEIPPPRAIVVRAADPVTVPVVVPVPMPAEEAVAVKPPAPEFKLPDTELLPQPNKCQSFGTRVRFHKGPGEATEEAVKAKKMLFVLHISGHFEDPGFT